MRRSLFALPLLVLLVVLAAQSEQSSLPGCEAPDALREALKDQLEPKELRLLTYQERQERQQHVLSALFLKYHVRLPHIGVGSSARKPSVITIRIR